MRGRPRDPDSENKMRQHLANGYLYAATVSNETSTKTGKAYRKYTHWGKLEDGKTFIPNVEFRLLPIERQNQFVFPDDWDVSSVTKARLDAENGNKSSLEKNLPGGDNRELTKMNENSRQIDDINVCNQFNNRLYGDVWLLEQIAKKLNIIRDLNIVFEYNRDIVNDILTLAIFPYITGKNFDRCAKWQKIAKTPSSTILTSSYITRLSQRIQDKHRMEFIRLRIERQPNGSYVACDSTTRSAWGNCLADIRWGKNKDNEKLKNTLEVVAYSLTTHEPIYYRTFPGNMSDIRTVRTIKSDLQSVGVKNLIFMFDRGYESKDNFREFFDEQIPFIMCSKTSQEPVRKFIEKIKYDSAGFPLGMIFDRESGLYCQQFKIDDEFLLNFKGNADVADNLYCNIYLDLIDRIEKIQKIRYKVEEEKKLLHRLIANNSYSEVTKIKNTLKYHKIIEDNDTSEKSITFVEKQKNIEKDETLAGFFSSIIYRNECTALESLKIYNTRDEQEKYFEQMKCQMNFHTQDSSSEDGKTGRLFFLFIGLILSSFVRNTWRNSVILRKSYRSSRELLDEMTPIRFCEYPDGSYHLTSFLSPQVEICKEFGIEVPEECLSLTERKAEERRTSGRSRGRPCKKDTPAHKIG